MVNRSFYLVLLHKSYTDNFFRPFCRRAFSTRRPAADFKRLKNP